MVVSAESELSGRGSERRRIGIEKATIDEMLCHVGDMKMADVYIETDWEIHRRANERIMALFDWGAIMA